VVIAALHTGRPGFLHESHLAKPAAVRARVRRASAQKLDHWAERLLDAKTLADVFTS